MFADAHIHLSDPELKSLLPQILLEAKATSKILIAVAVDAITSKLNLELEAKAGGTVRAFGGVHPWSAQSEDADSLRAVLDPSNLAGIGEVGLDRKYAKDEVEYKRQKEVFESMLKLAERLQKPLSIHSRSSVDDVLATLSTYNLRNVLLHWFAGTPQQLKEACERGYFISYGPSTVYSKKIQRLALSTPPTSILTETDGPVSFGAAFQNKPALPAFIPSVVYTLSTLHRLDFEDMRSIIFENTLRYLSLKNKGEGG
ncbi:MAG: TatD family hydrolase [Nitrososphaerales archaeon]